MLYRKHRPTTFDEVLGQEIIITILKNFLKQRERLPQAYLFAGQRGTGKTTLARIFAKTLNCLESETDPCGRCFNCLTIGQGQFLDIIEIDAASNRGIDEIRGLKEHIGFQPMQGKYKVFILDEAHMLTEPAWNAFLKTLEEPPRSVIFILATTEPEKIPNTILSRLQRFDFRRVASAAITQKLAKIAQIENLQVEPAALTLIAGESGGSLRDAETLLEKVLLSIEPGQAVSEAAVEQFLGKVSERRLLSFLELVLSGQHEAALTEINQIFAEGFELLNYTRHAIGLARELLLCKVHTQWKQHLQRLYTAELVEQFQVLAAAQPVDHLTQLLDLLLGAETSLRYDPPVPTLPLELAVTEFILKRQGK